MKPEETIDFFLKTAWLSVATRYNQIAAGHGMTQSLGYMLIHIHEEGTPVSTLAALMGVKPTSLSRMLSSMEKLGLIYREGNAADKRSVKIFLSPSGKEKRKKAKEVVRSFNDYLNRGIDEQERLQFIHTLKKISQMAADY